MSSKTKKKAAASKPKKSVAKAAPKVATSNDAASTTDYRIENDAYFPGRGHNLAKTYPFALLAIGQSFFEAAAHVDTSNYVDASEADKAWKESAGRAQNRLQAAKRTYTKNGGEGVFSIRMLNDPKLGWGARCKRMA